MSKSAIIKALDEHLQEFCAKHAGYQIFRIGSSLFESEIPIHDIDYFLVNENSETDFTSRIHDLKSNFSGKDFLKSAVYTNDPLIEADLNSIESNLKQTYQQEIKHAFGFGPIVMPADEKTLVLHLAGPMNIHSSNYFFKLFPLFHLLWSKYHVQLGNKEFGKLISDPGYTQEDIQEEYKRIYSRAATIDLPYIKKQCLKRLTLVELTLQGHPNPFVESVNQSINKTPDEVLIGLERFKQKILE